MLPVVPPAISDALPRKSPREPDDLQQADRRPPAPTAFPARPSESGGLNFHLPILVTRGSHHTLTDAA
jgi:hypothetical protein